MKTARFFPPSLLTFEFICHLRPPSNPTYLVVGQVQLLDLLVGDALGQHIDALVCEDVVGKAEVGDVHQLVHPGHHVVQQGVCKLAVPEGNPMIC